MKKVFVLLMILLLSLFALTACDGLVPAEGEDEGEGEGEIEGVAVEIEGAIDIDGKTYLSRGEHDITVTFLSPVTGVVKGYITYCTGDYSKKVNGDGTEVVLFPNSDRTIWTGSGSFRDSASWCCASYLEITSGECEDEVCIRMPVIVDSEDPYALFELKPTYCECGGCAVEFYISKQVNECSTNECCADDCTELDTGAIAIYDEDPFDQCCNIPCVEPVWTCSFDCPEDINEAVCVTDCLEPQGTFDESGAYEGNPNAPMIYYIVVSLIDSVGNNTRYYAQLRIRRDEQNDKCLINVQDFYADTENDLGDCDCTSWIYGPGFNIGTLTVGSCSDVDVCCTGYNVVCQDVSGWFFIF